MVRKACTCSARSGCSRQFFHSQWYRSMWKFIITPEKPAAPARRESRKVVVLALNRLREEPSMARSRARMSSISQQVSFMKAKRPDSAHHLSSSRVISRL